MNRRRFLAASLGCGLAAPLAGSAQSNRSERPNIVSISVDDMNDWVGCLGGYPGVKTPNIDRLARRGALFRDAHTASPLCNPSRTALFSGKRPDTTGVYGNSEFWRPANPELVTLPMHLRANGYYAAGAGKIFHHTSGNNPPDQWDEFRVQHFDDPWYRRPAWYPWVERMPPPPGHPFNGLAGDNFAGEFDWGVLPGRPERAYGDWTAVRYAEDFLARRHERPFFLAIGFWHPHIPMFAPQRYFDLYPKEKVRLPEVPGDDLDDLPPLARQFAAVRRSEHERILSEGKWADAVQAYLASITFADSMVGRVLDALEGSEHAQNTIIVFWSDHGWHLGEKRHWHKGTLWQRATHVPLIFAGPGVERVGVDRPQPVSLLDIYPTLLELAGLEPKDDLEGLSLGPLLRDPGRERPPAVVTYQQGNHAVVSSRWRYIRYRDGGEELYDRVRDPDEWRNLADRRDLEPVKRELARWIPERSVDPAPGRDAYEFDYETYTYRRR